MLLRQLYHENLAQASYLIGCQATGEAIVIDPHRQTALYTSTARQHGLRIVAVAETHIHADMVSGARELASETGARLLLPVTAEPPFAYAAAYLATAEPVIEGTIVTIGKVQLEAIHTPGHTPEHICFIITDTASSEEPLGVLTGDCLFVGAVGRPDLAEKSLGITGSATKLALMLHSSLARLRALPEFVQVWPGHGSGSACGKALGAVLQSSIGYEIRANSALRIADPQTFAGEVLNGQTAPPPAFAIIKESNRSGPVPRHTTDTAPQDPAMLAALLASGAQIVDVRPAAEYAAAPVRGVNLPLGKVLFSWAGWLLRYDRPIVLLGTHAAACQAHTDLQLLGYDDRAGIWLSDAVADMAALQLPPIARQPAATVSGAPADGVLLDVRNDDEVAQGSIPGSIHIPLAQLEQHIAAHGLPAQTITVHCQSGIRSAIAASMLASHGAAVTDLTGGYNGWLRTPRG